MRYTVHQLAQLAGVSVRTLHHYDEIGLLKPAFVGESGYRYYQQKQLLLLQQILFFKELGFELKRIKEIVGRSDFAIARALQTHKLVLEQKLERIKTLLKTIEVTISHVEGNAMMRDTEMFCGFSREKQAEYEMYLVDTLGKTAEAKIAESHANVKDWGKQDWNTVKNEFHVLNQALTKALQDGLTVDAHQVQDLIRRYFAVIQKFYQPTKEIFRGLGQLYMQHPDFRKVYDSYHPRLAEYLAEGMKVFADKEL